MDLLLICEVITKGELLIKSTEQMEEFCTKTGLHLFLNLKYKSRYLTYVVHQKYVMEYFLSIKGPSIKVKLGGYANHKIPKMARLMHAYSSYFFFKRTVLHSFCEHL